MTPVEMLIALWSHVTSLWLLVRRNPSRAFTFKYYKAPGASIATEEHEEGRLEFELTDFTHDVPRWLEMSTLKGVGRLVYRAGLRETTSIFETHSDTTNDNAENPLVDPDVRENSLPNQGVHTTVQTPPTRPPAARRNPASPSPSSQQSGDSWTKGPKSG
ncbi:hypothetical protein BKA70DRAFT_1329263 [Coprinopsis sp. MPI-PUGE-AT-0042]|nr:hypothetical protein BKA70DRAFT_1329263 [Coprinopsis sp. MPI-PUGE-AT-0042]